MGSTISLFYVISMFHLDLTIHIYIYTAFNIVVFMFRVVLLESSLVLLLLFLSLVFLSN